LYDLKTVAGMVAIGAMALTFMWKVWSTKRKSVEDYQETIVKLLTANKANVELHQQKILGLTEQNIEIQTRQTMILTGIDKTLAVMHSQVNSHHNKLNDITQTVNGIEKSLNINNELIDKLDRKVDKLKVA